MGWLVEIFDDRFVSICSDYGLTEQESLRLFEHIWQDDGIIREYQIRLFFGIGQDNAERLLDELVTARYVSEDKIPSPDGKTYVDEISDEEAEKIARIELGIDKPLWRENVL